MCATCFYQRQHRSKGVQICKENLLCFVDWYKDFCPVTEQTVALKPGQLFL